MLLAGRIVGLLLDPRKQMTRAIARRGSGGGIRNICKVCDIQSQQDLETDFVLRVGNDAGRQVQPRI